MSGTFDFGVRSVKGSGEAHGYRGASGGSLLLEQSYAYEVRTGDHTWIGALATAGWTVPSVEWRSGGPAGTLLDIDVFTGSVDPSVHGWTASPFGGWSAVTAGGVKFTGGSFSHGMYKLTPPGADTCIIRGCYFDVENGPYWGMISLHAHLDGNGGGGLGGNGNYGHRGVRYLIGEAHPHAAGLVDIGVVIEPPDACETVTLDSRIHGNASTGVTTQKVLTLGRRYTMTIDGNLTVWGGGLSGVSPYNVKYNSPGQSTMEA